MNERTRKRIANAVKRAWADPERKARWRAALREAGKKPEVRKHRSEGRKRLLADPAAFGRMQAALARPKARRKQSAGIRDSWKRPDVRRKHEEATVTLLADPARKQEIIDRLVSASRTPEALRKRSEASKAKWLRPGFRARARKAMKRAQNRPEVRKQKSESTTKVWAERNAILKAAGKKVLRKRGAPAKWKSQEIEQAKGLYAKLGSWSRVAKHLRRSEWDKDPQGAADRLRLAVGYAAKKKAIT